MSDDKLKYDKLQQVEEALKKSSVDPDGKSIRLVCVAVVQAWSPPSLHLAKEVERVRKLGVLKSPIFLVDADAEPAKLADMGLTPSLSFFVGGQPLTIRRTGWADDVRFSGSVSSAHVTELFQSARSAEADGSSVMQVEF